MLGHNFFLGAFLRKKGNLSDSFADMPLNFERDQIFVLTERISERIIPAIERPLQIGKVLFQNRGAFFIKQISVIAHGRRNI